MRSQAEVTGRLEWVPDEQLATGRYDRWFELIERHADGIDIGPGLIVRRRVADEAQPVCACDPAPHREQDGTYSHWAGCPIADACSSRPTDAGARAGRRCRHRRRAPRAGRGALRTGRGTDAAEPRRAGAGVARGGRSRA